MHDPRRVVIVEDDFLVTEYLRSLCEDIGLTVAGNATEADGALRLIDELCPDFVLTDVRLPGPRDGVDVARAIRERCPGTRVVFVTGSGEPATLARVAAGRPHRVLIKPIDPEDLREAFGGEGMCCGACTKARSDLPF